MDPIIQQTIDGMLSSFAHVQVADPAVAEEIEQFKRDMTALGERSTDAGSFMGELTSSGLMALMSDLMVRASTPAAPESAPQATPSGGGSPTLPTVREFLEQYRSSYEAAQAHGFQFTAVQAYNELFAVANRTDDLLEMNILLESEGHLRAITAAALYDIHKLNHDTTDPNNQAVRRGFSAMMKIAQTYRTDEELYYGTDLAIAKNQQSMLRHQFLIVLAAQLALVLVGYGTAKTNARMDLEKFAGAFVATRLAIQNTYAALQELFNLDFDAMVAHPWMKHWMLVPKTLDSTGRVTSCLDTRNLDYMREVLFEEALSDLTDLECLERVIRNPFFPSLDVSFKPEQAAVEQRIQAVGAERLKGKYYHGYDQKVKVPGMA